MAEGAVLLGTDAVRRVAARAMAAGHFWQARGLRLEWEHRERETLRWEVCRGRLLDPGQTREERTFEAWNVYLRNGASRSAEPVLALKLDETSQCLHITRSVLCHAWEGYHAGGNVYLSRETQKWVPELVAAIALADHPTEAGLQAEIEQALFRAVVGCSRLPLTSIEAPLPAFTLGELAYLPPRFPEEAERPCQTVLATALAPDVADLVRTKALEWLLRAVPTAELADAARVFVAECSRRGRSPRQTLALLRSLFEEVALSPYTDFVDRTLAFVALLVELGHLTIEDRLDYLGYLLRQLGRHLTAYDLVTYHHRGANYPDALLLDAVLRQYLDLARTHPDLFRPGSAGTGPTADRARLRRRALRQGWLFRRWYEGHPVPDLPVSPGENARVLPPPHFRVPDEQIADPTKRTRRLYSGEPLIFSPGDPAADLLRQSLADLTHAEELRELGLALFLERPLGVFKGPGEPDRTILLSHEAFSQAIARRRLAHLKDLARDLPGTTAGLVADEAALELPVPGLPVRPSGLPTRPGVVSLDDAWKVSPDFLLLRTTSRAVREFLAQYDLTSLAHRVDLGFLHSGQPVVIASGASTIGSAAGSVVLFDAGYRPRLEVTFEAARGYLRRGNDEFPAGGLQAARVWENEVAACDLLGRDRLVLPRKGG